MFFANYVIKDILVKINSQIKSVKASSNEIRAEKAKTYGFIYDLRLAMNELYIATNDDSYLTYKSFLNSKLDETKECEDGVRLLAVLEAIKSRLEPLNLNETIFPEYNYRRYESNSTIDVDFIKTVASNIKTNRKFNAFHIQCRIGDELEVIKKEKPNAICYGIEESNGYAEAAKKKADKIIKGQIKGSRIKNEAFDLLIANCPIKYNLENNMSFGAIMKAEKYMLQNIYKYSSPNGVVVIGIPYYRLYKDICSIIAKNYKNVSIVKSFGQAEREYNLNMVYIVGQRDDKKVLDEDIYNRLRQCGDYDKVPSLFNNPLPEYELGKNFVEIDLFKGSVLDMEELYEIVETSGCLENMLKKQNVDKINENTKRPLLPFNVGQIGLVLTSGCLDGIIDEGDGHYHLVKGRVSKKSDKSQEMSDGILEETEILSNRVEINVILPNGEFKTLA